MKKYEKNKYVRVVNWKKKYKLGVLSLKGFIQEKEKVATQSM